MAKITKMLVGESLVGDGNEVAHIDLIIGPRGTPAETAFANAITNNKDGFTALLAVVAPNLMTKPATCKAVMDCVAEGTIPEAEADDLFISVGVFIHWLAEDDKKIQEYNYTATKEAIERAVSGEPKTSEVVSKKDSAEHPFAAK